VVEDKDERPREDLVVHCFCMCGAGALLGGLPGVSRSVGHEFLSVLFYPVFLLNMFSLHPYCIFRDIFIVFIVFDLLC